MRGKIKILAQKSKENPKFNPQSDCPTLPVWLAIEF